MRNLPTREEALSLLREVGCGEGVIRHCLAVERKALELAELVSRNGVKVDRELVGIGALLHDIGRSVTHGIRHGVEGGRILREKGFPELSRFAENHLGAGIPKEEAVELGLPGRDFLPLTVEEKLVTYADKLVEGEEEVGFEGILERFKRELGSTHPALERLRKLHEEIVRMAGGRG
ncbi:MAG: TIGR00295 family protein [Hadesarchaea archaeon]|nr:MAG: TIGR00295 family protein [Hadesarchaea archaeon]